jgi:branched-chain amino acid transport system ATP-binding protein
LSTLEIKHLSKSFGGLQAVQDFECTATSGQIHALIGPNGAGKSTIFNLICGVIKPDSGQVLLDGDNLVGLPPHKVTAKGIARTFQNVRLFKNMPVRDNIVVAIHAAHNQGILLAILTAGPGSTALRSEYEQADAVLDIVGLGHRAQVQAKNLPYGEQKRVELARALACPAKALLLDEPTTGMNPTEAVAMMDTIHGIKDRGMAILLVEHNMRVVMDISDVVTVMDFGHVICSGTPEHVCQDEGVIAAYLGERR